MGSKFDSIGAASENRSVNARIALARRSELEADRQSAPNASVPQNDADRRLQRRLSVGLPVRLSAVNLEDGNLDEVLGTYNSSRGGLYFMTSSDRFYEKMRLRVEFPYHCAHDVVPASEQYGEVVRLDRLPDGRFGVALRLRTTVFPNRAVAVKPNEAAQKAVERRRNSRYHFSAAATVIETPSRARLQARSSDLSVGGCYIDTINPFPERAHVQLRLTSGKINFRVTARVCFSHMGMGMGLAFSELNRQQELELLDWLTNDQNKGEAILIAEPSKTLATTKSPSPADRALALRLVRLLRSKGALTEADVKVLLAGDQITDEELESRPCADRL